MYRTYVKRPPAMETNEYEILPKNLSLDETPLQKLRRLMYEVQELNDEMEKAKVIGKTCCKYPFSLEMKHLIDTCRSQQMQRKPFHSLKSFLKSPIYNQI